MAISITKPVVNGSNNTWGDTINTALDTIVDAVNGNAGEVAPDLTEGGWKIGGTAVSATAAELNVMDGDTSATSTTVEGTDSIVMNDGGIMKQVSMSDIATYTSAQVADPNDATVTITAGNAMTGGGSFSVDQASASTITINHEDTSSQSSVNNSGNTYIQDVTLDTYGHVTGLTSATISLNSQLTDSQSLKASVTLYDGTYTASEGWWVVSCTGQVNLSGSVVAFSGVQGVRTGSVLLINATNIFYVENSATFTLRSTSSTMNVYRIE